MTGLPGVPRKIRVTQKDMSVLSGWMSVVSGWCTCTLTSKLFLIRTLFYAKFAILWGRYLECVCILTPDLPSVPISTFRSVQVVVYVTRKNLKEPTLICRGNLRSSTTSTPAPHVYDVRQRT